MDEFLKLFLLALVAGCGAFLGSYLKRKGENLATHEDIDELVEQVRAVTTATKEIEAKISIDMWDRQKRWEMKREVVFEATKRVALVMDKVPTVHSSHQAQRDSIAKGEAEWPQGIHQAITEFSDAANSLDQVVPLLSLVCGERSTNDLLDFSAFSRNLVVKIIEGDAEAFKKSRKEFLLKSIAVTNALRRELGIDSRFDNRKNSEP